MRERRYLSLLLTVLLTLPSLLVFFPADAILRNPGANEQWALSQSGWLAGWDYRESHTITGSAGAGTDYQIRVIVHYSAGTDSGADVYCDSHCQPDFDDIRFTTNDGTTPLSYWRERYTDSSVATFWVKVTDNLDSDATVFTYYGNGECVTTSNGTETFVFFDDFEDEEIGANPDNTNWQAPLGESGTSDVVNVVQDPVDADNQVVLAKESGDSVATYLLSRELAMDRDVALGWKWRRNEVELIYNAFVGTMAEIARWRSPAPYDHLEWRLSGSDEYADFTPSWTDCAADTWYSCEWRFSSSGLTGHGWDDGDTFTGGYFSSYPSASGYLNYFNVPSSHRYRANSYWTDDVYVRNYVAAEPGHGPWGVGEPQSSTTTSQTGLGGLDPLFVTVIGVGTAVVVLVALVAVLLRRGGRQPPVQDPYKW